MPRLSIAVGLASLLLAVAGCGDDARPGDDAGSDAGRDGGGGGDAGRDGGGVDGGGVDGGGVDGGGVDGGGSDGGGSDGGGSDGGGSDGGGSDGGGTDAGGDDAGEMDAGCFPPPCPPPPPGCMYVGSDPCSCGMLVCEGCGFGDSCAEDQFCDYEAPEVCGGPGSCQPRPEICLGIFDPVCGCDGVDYPSECNAHAAGTDVASRGMCSAPPDCRETGCDPGSSCMPCRGPGGGVYVCIPDGAVC